VVANLLGSTGLPPDIVQRIVTAAEGNPLYVEQMLAMLIDTAVLRYADGQWVRGEGQGEVSVPPTIQALIEARLDGLARADRAALEPAAVIGLEFPHVAVETMVPEAIRQTLGGHMDSLEKKHFIRPAHKEHGELLYRFHHQLVRDTAYNGLLKRNRANLHLAFVRWADGVNADRDRALEFQEILGYHLEQAHRYLKELGPLDEAGIAVGIDAAGRLSGAGRRAFARSDMHAAANLLGRAAALLPKESRERLGLLPELGEALMELGRFEEARAALADAIALAGQVGDETAEIAALLVDMFVRLYSGEAGDWAAEALRTAEAAIPTLQAAGAHNTLATAWRLVGFVHGVAGRYRQANEATVHYMANARKAGNQRLVARSGMGLAMGALSGPTPVPEAIAECEGILAGGLADRQVQSVIGCVLAQLHAMNGDFNEARRLYRQGRAMLRELGQGVSAATTGIDLARVELLAGDLAGAEREIRADHEFLKKTGETYVLSSLEGMLARIVRDLGRDAEALELSKSVEASAAEDDVEAQVQWRSLRAPILARAGDIEGALLLARSAVEMARASEAPILLGEALWELSVVLAHARLAEESRQHAAEAAAIFERKGDAISVRRIRASVDEPA
jgi:tetratricopeptide (TPR) repeat protein